MKNYLTAAAVVAACLAYLFWPSWAKSDLTLFSNDGPLGALMAEQCQPPATASGIWQDLNWLGGEQPAHIGIAAGFRILTQSPRLPLLAVLVAFALCVRKFGARRTLASLCGVMAVAYLSVAVAGLAGFIPLDYSDYVAPMLPIGCLLLPFLMIGTLLTTEGDNV